MVLFVIAKKWKHKSTDELINEMQYIIPMEISITPWNIFSQILLYFSGRDKTMGTKRSEVGKGL